MAENEVTVVPKMEEAHYPQDTGVRKASPGNLVIWHDPRGGPFNALVTAVKCVC